MLVKLMKSSKVCIYIYIYICIYTNNHVPSRPTVFVRREFRISRMYYMDQGISHPRPIRSLKSAITPTDTQM